MLRFASIAALAAAVSVTAAPLPPPRKLTPELLVGHWQFEWGTATEGWIVFHEDGGYYSRHQPGILPDFAGRWSVDEERGTVTLHEGRIPCLESGEALTIRMSYPMRLSTADYPALKGSCGATPVVLRRR